MKAITSFALIVILFLGGWIKNSDDEKIQITTSSDEARKEFLQGSRNNYRLAAYIIEYLRKVSYREGFFPRSQKYKCDAPGMCIAFF